MKLDEDKIVNIIRYLFLNQPLEITSSDGTKNKIFISEDFNVLYEYIDYEPMILSLQEGIPFDEEELKKEYKTLENISFSQLINLIQENVTEDTYNEMMKSYNKLVITRDAKEKLWKSRIK